MFRPTSISFADLDGKVRNSDVSDDGLLLYCPHVETSGDREAAIRLVIPEGFQSDFLHYFHTSLEGVHQEIGRTYHRIRRRFHWRGLF